MGQKYNLTFLDNFNGAYSFTTCVRTSKGSYRGGGQYRLFGHFRVFARKICLVMKFNY